MVFAAQMMNSKLLSLVAGGFSAAGQALNTHDQGPIKLVAMADAFEDRLEGSLNNLARKHGDRVDVPEDRRFYGFEGYKKAIALADVVILPHLQDSGPSISKKR